MGKATAAVLLMKKLHDFIPKAEYNSKCHLAAKINPYTNIKLPCSIK
jgi:hypothetical protein